MLALAVAAAPLAPQAEAATPNIAVGGGQVMVLPFHISGAVSATTAGVVRFQMPQPCDLIGFGTNPRAMTGASNTIDLKVGGVSVLSAAVTQTAATWTEGTISTVTVADEAVVTVDFTVPAGSLTDTTIVITCARR